MASRIQELEELIEEIIEVLDDEDLKLAGKVRRLRELVESEEEDE